MHCHIVEFIAYAQTQFGTTPKSFQADNGNEFVNATTSFLTARGITLRLSCPYTSPQNGKAERMLRTTTNTIRTMLLHASMPPPYWAEALSTTTFLLKKRPSSSICNQIPHQILHDTLPDYSSLRVFGCLCYPNLTATTPTNSHLGPHLVSSSDTHPPTRATAVLTWPLAALLSLVMSFLTSLCFHSRQHHRRLPCRCHLTF